MSIKFTNNASATLASGITNVATSLTLTSGQGALFPTLSGSDVFYVTLTNTSNAIEIVKVTAISTDTLTIVRAQDNTTARAWSTGDKVELRPIAAVMAAMVQSGQALGTPSSGTATNLTGLPLSTGVTGTLPIANGGTGQTTASAAFNALAPVTSTGDLIVGNGTNSSTRLPIGTNGYLLTSNGTTASWAAAPSGMVYPGAGIPVSTGSGWTTSFNDSGTPITAAYGGTGLASPGTSGNVLTSNGTSWVSQAVSGLPSQTGNSGKYLTTDGTNASWATFAGALATPTLSPSTTTPTGGSTMTITISNYNSSYTYIIAVQAGSYTFNTSTGVITWTVANVSSTTSSNCTVQATYSGQASVVATQTVSVQTSLVSDTAISITNFASYSSNNGWAI